MVPGRHATSVRRALAGVLDWLDEHDSVRTIVVGLAVLGPVAAIALLVRPDSVPDGPEPTRAPEPDRRMVEYVNAAGGYGFVVPSTWTLEEDGPTTRIENPSGRIVVSFGPGSAGTLAEASARLLRSLPVGPSERELIGRRRDRIGGAPSLLVSGTGRSGDRAVRFLAITVHAGPPTRNLAITISVPARSDPERVLPRLEEIVSSFRVVAPDGGVPVA
jgi:hypothetical protein